MKIYALLLIFTSLIFLACEGKFEESKMLAPNFSNITKANLLKHGFERVPEDVPLYVKEHEGYTEKFQFWDFESDVIYMQMWVIRNVPVDMDSLSLYLRNYDSHLSLKCESKLKHLEVLNFRYNTFLRGYVREDSTIFLSYYYPSYTGRQLD